MEEQEETRGKVGWNLKSQLSFMILENLQGAGRGYASGDIPGWFWSLSAARELINHDLKEKEAEALDALEVFIKKGIPIWSKYLILSDDGEIIKKSMRNNIKLFTDKVMVYQRNLMSLLNAMGYFPKKENRKELNF